MASQDMNFDETLKSLYEQYKERGYITEDQILDCAYSADVLSKLTERLLDLGVVIQEEPVKAVAEKDEENYDASRTDYDVLFNKVVEECPELKSFIKYVKQIKPPQFKEWQTLFPQAKNGNHWAEDRLFEMYLRVVVKTAWNYHKKYNIDLSDAIQEGATGLLSAIEKFDISEYNAFTTFIARPIANTITRNCEFPYYVIYDLPTLIKEDLIKIYEIYENHQCPECMCKPRKNECETLKDEIVAKLNCSLEDAREYLNILTEHEHEIFDLPDENLVPAFDICSQKQLEQVVRSILMDLSPKEQYVIRERYISEQQKTLEDVGDFLGVTRERVRQIEIQALNKLKHPTRARALRSFLDDGTSYSVANMMRSDVQTQSRVKTNIADSNKLDEPDEVWDVDRVNELRKYLDQGLPYSEVMAKMNIPKREFGKIARKTIFGEESNDSIDAYIILEDLQKIMDKSQTSSEFLKKANETLPIKQLEKLQDRLFKIAIFSSLDYSRLESLEEERLVNKMQRIINKNKNKTMQEAVDAIKQALKEEEQRILDDPARCAKIVKELDYSKLKKAPK